MEIYLRLMLKAYAKNFKERGRLMKIILPPKDLIEYTATCKLCGCQFSYDYKDLHTAFTSTNSELNIRYVECPGCGTCHQIDSSQKFFKDSKKPESKTFSEIRESVITSFKYGCCPGCKHLSDMYKVTPDAKCSFCHCGDMYEKDPEKFI